ncbi:sunset domain-containing protein [Rhizobium leguminosarum]|uniref:sunset domain-containing protein n=1 Tax=Rhizobium leguminosarum TaxID=384 RepID=UPI004039DD24
MACNIKGNVTIGSRERIYHMPGQEYYDETRISPRSGGRWFCSEAEARAAGWRRAIR